MSRWTLAVVAAAALAGLAGCDQEPPRTTVQPPGASLPEDTVLKAPQASALPASAPEAPPAAAAAPAEAPVAAASGPAPAGTQASGDATAIPHEPAPPNVTAMGAQSAASAAVPATPDGVAAPTEMSGATPPAGAASAPAQGKVSALPPVHPSGDSAGAGLLAQHGLMVPVTGIQPTQLSDNYEQSRGQRKHEAIDILAPTGTPVVAVDSGRIAKLFTSKPGGLTIYQFDPQQRLAYYYAHLQAYAPGVKEGMEVKRGDLLGYVGSTGNADPRTPHLHFAIFRLGTPPKWWEGEPVNPYPALSQGQASSVVAAR